MDDHDKIVEYGARLDNIEDLVTNHIPSDIRQLRQWVFVGFGGIGAALIAALVKLFVG